MLDRLDRTTEHEGFRWTIGVIVSLLMLVVPLFVLIKNYSVGMSPHGFAEMAAVVVALGAGMVFGLDRVLLYSLGYRQLMRIEAVLLFCLLVYVGYQVYDGWVDPLRGL